MPKKPQVVSKVFLFDINAISNVDSMLKNVCFVLLQVSLEDDALKTRAFKSLADSGLIDYDEERRVIDFITLCQLWERVDILSGVRDLIVKLNSNPNYRVIYMSDRGEILREQTEKWMKNNGLPLPVSHPGDVDNLNQRCVLLISDNKKSSINKVVHFHGSDNVYYFEKELFYLEHANHAGVRNLYTTSEGFFHLEDKDIDEVLSKIKTVVNGGYSGLNFP